MNYKAVLFDLDGTLLDTLDDLADSANRVLAGMNMPQHPLDSYRYFVGDGMMTLLKRIVPEDKRDKESLARITQAFRQDYGNNWAVKSKPYDGIGQMLAGLKQRGLRLAILSNKAHDFTRLCVQQLLGEFSFNPVLGQREEVAKKPDPAGALEVAELLGIPPKDFLYLGDTSIDMHTAKSAGMCAVGALWGFRTREELLKSGADHVLENPVDLLDLIE
jgi:phosphoglycolate phosphatase